MSVIRVAEHTVQVCSFLPTSLQVASFITFPLSQVWLLESL